MPDKIIRDIPLIQRYSRHNEGEDFAFRAFLKGRLNLSDEELDAVAQETTDEVWKQIDCLTCGNCCGSPSRSRLAAAEATAMVLAKQNCPASSITSRSRLPGGTRVGLAKSQAVPPMTHPVVPVMNPAYSVSWICCHPTS